MAPPGGVCVGASFVDIGELLIRSPRVLLPARVHRLDAATWAVKPTSMRRRVRSSEWLVRLDSLVIEGPGRATLSAAITPVPRGLRTVGAGRATLVVHALAAAREARTELALTFELPSRRVGARGMRRRSCDASHRTMHALVERLEEALADGDGERSLSFDEELRQARRSHNG